MRTTTYMIGVLALLSWTSPGLVSRIATLAALAVCVVCDIRAYRRKASHGQPR